MDLGKWSGNRQTIREPQREMEPTGREAGRTRGRAVREGEGEQLVVFCRVGTLTSLKAGVSKFCKASYFNSYSKLFKP